MSDPLIAPASVASPSPGVAAALLCAGGGSRYDRGRPGAKLVAPWRGRPLVVWAVDHLVAANFDTVFVVTGPADLAGLLPDDVAVVENPDWKDGLATSLQVAISAARSAEADVKALVVGLGDQPLIGPEAWRAVASAGGPIAVATYGGRRRNPVKLARAVWGQLPTTGDEGARALMRSRPELVVEVPCPGDPLDIDTKDDLAGTM
ncbi:MAG TPA: nucleotidyltransferase family protein [Acidimicrobiales bacterium]|nr:nucleotidyltransferase family protein [Acidimicrobiales bacterium]